MKKILLVMLFLSHLSLSFGQEGLQHVNLVLADESYEKAFGIPPSANSNEQLRIQTHLAYVETLLRERPSLSLSHVQQLNRQLILNLLHDYQEAAKFPVNRDYPGERRPCFIDADGNICAVGYLIEQTKGREIAEAINANHQYDFITEMNEPLVAKWAAEYGLTLEECAMIQPAYGPPPPPETVNADIKSGYGIASGLMSGTNVVISASNISGRWKNSRTLSYIGLASGTTQVIMGIANIKKTAVIPKVNGGEIHVSYKAQNYLSYANIAAGTTTLISSVINLALQKKNDKRTAIGLFSFPNSSQSITMGLSLSRRI